MHGHITHKLTHTNSASCVTFQKHKKTVWKDIDGMCKRNLKCLNISHISFLFALWVVSFSTKGENKTHGSAQVEIFHFNQQIKGRISVFSLRSTQVIYIVLKVRKAAYSEAKGKFLNMHGSYVLSVLNLLKILSKESVAYIFIWVRSFLHKDRAS